MVWFFNIRLEIYSFTLSSKLSRREEVEFIEFNFEFLALTLFQREIVQDKKVQISRGPKSAHEKDKIFTKLF
jgi:hypothetical protein